jgi:primary-amine oxidase
MVNPSGGIRMFKKLAISVTCLVFVVMTGSVAFAATRHPLDALQPNEYPAVRDILLEAGKISDTSVFAMIRLEEPPKAAVLSWSAGDPIPRTAFAVVRKGPRMYEARVDLAGRRVLSYDEVAGRQSSILFSEWMAAQEITKSDPGWQAAMRKRGYDRIDPKRFECMPLSAGYFAIPELQGKRILRVQCLDLEGAKKQIYQRPIENLTAVVDVNAGRVIQLIDDGPVPVPGIGGDYDEESLKPYKPAMKPIVVSQPDGPSFTFDGSFVDWGPWRFHLRLDRRRGTIVSLARFEGRSVLYQASLSEMWVPYMDPSSGWSFKSYFDSGEYGFGMFATPLVRGVDCPDYARLVDHAIALDDAEPVPYPDAICLFERPTMNPAWRHAEMVNETFGGRPGRELVVRMIAAIGNYDYVYDYIFMPTGALRVSVASTGIDMVKAVRAVTMSDPTADEDTRYGTLIAPNLVGVSHDHFFSLRFDLDVDGTQNSFVRDRIVRTALSDDNPRRSIWTVQSERVRTEGAAQLDIDLKAPEQWRIQSTTAKNAMGNPTGYVIGYSGNAYPQLSDDDYPQRRAGFAKHHLWVTPYEPDELFAAGNYPNQSKGGDGLPAWTAQNRSIDDTDLVVWYTLGFHHITAAEDWPVLPTHPKSVTLRPFNFFDRSQVINLAPASE